MSQAQRFADLPEHTKKFFESLSEEDTISLREGIRLARATKTMGKFWKWVAITAVAVFGGALTIGQSVEYLIEKVRGQ